jgi:rubredoxin
MESGLARERTNLRATRGVAGSLDRPCAHQYDDEFYSKPFSTLMTDAQPFRTWMCLICGWIYDEATGRPEDGIAPGTRWEDVPVNWTCPECGARKEDFEMVEI